MTGPEPLPLALRAYATRERDAGDDDDRAAGRRWWPRRVVVFDCETTTDAGQQLNFGSWRYYRVEWPKTTGEPRMRCAEEGLFYDDDLPTRYPRGFQALRRYCARHPPDVDRTLDDAAWRLTLYSRSEFVEEILFRVGFEQKAAIVGFNLPFDLSRLALGAGEGRTVFRGGFTLPVSVYTDASGVVREASKVRPRIWIKTIDSKRHLITFRDPEKLDDDQASPERGAGEQPFRGHFLDLRTLAFALTDESYTLKRACEDFGVRRGKTEPKRHGRINQAYITYNRRDVEASGALFAKLMGEYCRHPIRLLATKAYSPASIGKAYLRAMGIEPILVRQPDFPVEVLGYAMSAYYGGRAEVRIRRTPVPVAYCDFLSMYPTVNALMGLWQLVTAQRIEIEDSQAVTDEVRAFVETITADECFAPDVWGRFVSLVQIEPDGDILPSRARYAKGGSWQIGVNPLSTRERLWYALPDVIAAKILSPEGRAPRIVRAIRLVSRGAQPGLKRVALGGEIRVDPRREDFFRSVIEQRKRLDQRSDLERHDRDRLSRFLKVLANATSYGVYAEMVRHELGTSREHVTVQRADGSSFDAQTNAPEDPGERFFAPMAALITAAARLMLALAEHTATRLGGSYAFCDTDSIAIVATPTGGSVPCAGGSLPTDDGREAIRALSWPQVEDVRSRFAALNPYDPSTVSGSVLELEDENYDGPRSRAPQRQLYCYAISAKRYALYSLDADGRPLIRPKKLNRQGALVHPGEKASEHGLGHLLNPTDPDDDDRDWIGQIWRYLVYQALGLDHPEPAWAEQPAISRMTATSPASLAPLKTYNQARPRPQQIKPFNFLLSAHTGPFDYPDGADPNRFHLIAPYESDPTQWLRLAWIDQYGGTDTTYTITTRDDHPTTHVRVQTYRRTITAYHTHPEDKSLDSNGTPCARATAGLLTRRPLRAETLTYVGKESNNLEDLAAGLIHDQDDILNEYHDPKQTIWRALILPVLREMIRRGISIAVLARRTGLHRRTIERYLDGTATPSAATDDALTQICIEYVAQADPTAARETRRAGVGLLRAHLDTNTGDGISDGRTCVDCVAHSTDRVRCAATAAGNADRGSAGVQSRRRDSEMAAIRPCMLPVSWRSVHPRAPLPGLAGPPRECGRTFHPSTSPGRA